MTYGAVQESPLNGKRHTLSRPGSKWSVTLSFSGLTMRETGILSSFLTLLDGFSHRFTLHDHSLLTPDGGGGGTPRVNGAGQTGTTLNTDGWPLSTSGVLLRGDMFSVNGELKKVTADASSNGSGQATIQFGPPLRKSPIDNALLDLTSPTGTFMLANPDNGWGQAPPRKGTVTLQAIEDIL